MDKITVAAGDTESSTPLPEVVDGKGNPDVELRLDEEDDSLYDDGLEVDTGAGGLAGTHGTTPGIAKP